MGALVIGLAPLIIGSLPEILVGAAVLLLVFALGVLLEKPLVAVLGAIPVIGKAAADGVSSGLAWVQRWVAGWAGGMVWPIIQVIIAPVQAVVGFASTTIGAIEYTMDQTRLLSNAAAGRFGSVARQISSMIGSLNSLTLRVASAAAAAAAGLGLAQLIRSTLLPQAREQAVSEAGTYTRGQVSAEAQARAQAIAQARAAAIALVGTETAARQLGDERVAATAAAAAAAIRAALGQLSSHVLTGTDVKVGNLEDEMTQVRTRAIPDEIARARAAESALVADLAIAQQALRCLEPLCSSGYSSLIGQLLQGAELLMLLEIVGQAVADPQGTAKEMAGLVSGVAGGAQAMLRPFIGGA